MLVGRRPPTPTGEGGAGPDGVCQLSGGDSELVAVLLPCFADLPEQVHEPGAGVVGTAQEGAPIRKQEDRHRPTAAAGHGLDGFHVDGVDVGTLLPVHFYVDEARVHHGRGRRVLKGFVGHHVAPVAGRVTDGKEDGHVPKARRCEGVRAPRVPVDGVPGVLAQVRAGLIRQAVHGVQATTPGCRPGARGGGSHLPGKTGRQPVVRATKGDEPKRCGHVPGGALGRRPGHEGVAVAPHEQAGNRDRRGRTTRLEGQGPIPVERPGQVLRARRSGGVSPGRDGVETLPLQLLGHPGAPAQGQQQLGQLGQLEQQHVPRPQGLAAPGQGVAHGHRRGSRQRSQAAHPVRVGCAEVPGDDSAPVVPDDVEAVGPGRGGQRQGVRAQQVHCVGPSSGRSRPGGVTPLVRGQDPVAGGCEQHSQAVPAVPVLRKPVQQQHDPTPGGAGVVDLECQAGVGVALHGPAYTGGRRSRRTFPIAVRGRRSTRTTCLGAAKGATASATRLRSVSRAGGSPGSAGHHPGHHPLAPFGVGPAGDRDLRHGGVGPQGRLDGGRPDVLAAGDDHLDRGGRRRAVGRRRRASPRRRSRTNRRPSTAGLPSR